MCESLLLWLETVCIPRCNCSHQKYPDIQVLLRWVKKPPVTATNTVTQRAKVSRNFIFHKWRHGKKTFLHLLKKFRCFYVQAPCLHTKQHCDNVGTWNYVSYVQGRRRVCLISRRESSLPSVFVPLGPRLIGWCPPTFSADLHLLCSESCTNLLWKHTYRHIQNNALPSY